MVVLAKKFLTLKDYQLLTLAWLFMLSLVCLNCTVHSLFIAKTRVDIASSIAWSLQKYGIWLLITPLICMGLQAQFSFKRILSIGVSALLIVLCVNTSLDILFEGIRWQESVFYNWHKHVFAYGGIVLVIWARKQLFSESSTAENCANSSVVVSDEKAPLSGHLVTSELRLAFSDIYYAKSSGNYIDIVTKHKTYLLRMTMKELIALLPSDYFIRTHRSYIVNLVHTEHMQNIRAGNANLVLANAQNVPVSKSKRQLVKQLLAQ
ncbi:hypothetical protein CWC15_18285 [Pseudoalteromonas spongiae]|nr:hypothetical protein CWC15_18285 [Pseudoalteromonas spongiae]